MKVVHIRIECENTETFKCSVSIDQLEREDCNEYERMIADDIEGYITKYVEILSDVMKGKLKQDKI